MPKGNTKKEPDSARKLDKIAKRLLRAAEVGDRLPTPQHDIIECAELIKGGEIDLDDFKESFLDKMRSVFFSGWGKIKGALAVRDKTIYISANVPESQKPFLNFHEVSHHVIPWQQEIYDLFADDTFSLSPEVEEKFEQEANYLSAQLLFQCDRLIKEAMDYELSIGTGIKFAKQYGASYHSTFWQYVEKNPAKCVLLVLKEAKYLVCNNGKWEKPYNLLYCVPSNSFLKEFGQIPWDEKYFSDHPFTEIVNANDGLEVHEGEFELLNMNKERVAVKYEAWTNTYNIFILISKRPKIRQRKWRVILTH